MNSKPLLISCPIVENRQIAPGYFLVKFSSAEQAGSVLPGQFFNIRVSDRLDIILRRPFSVFDRDEVHISILYEIVGKGTRELSRKQPGEQLDVLGPLGKGFSLEPETRRAVIVGGGMGIAPLYPWVKQLLRQKDQGRDLEIQIFIGGKTKYQILCVEEFRRLGLEAEIATDDGSQGFSGLVTDLFRERLASSDLPAGQAGPAPRQPAVKIYACGPNNMLKEVARVVKEKDIPGELSLDRHMACGLGVCLGCVVKIKADTEQGYSYKRVCKDGPVFPATDLFW